MDILKAQHKVWRQKEAQELRRVRRVLQARNEQILATEPDFITPAVTVLACLLLAGLMLVASCQTAHAKTPGIPVEINMVRIAGIESNYNQLAYNRESGARGLCQVTAPVLVEFNERFYTTHKPDDLFNKHLNMVIGLWYMNERIPQLLRHYRISDSINNRLIAYNFGIGNLNKWHAKGGRFRDLPAETQNYIRAYKKQKK